MVEVPSQRGTSGSRVLIVDDAAEIRQTLEVTLSREGFEVMTVADGEAAVDRVATWEPDLVVLDVVLPDITGIEVCRRIREISGAMVLMLTACDDEIDKIVGLSAGADDYLTKPFSLREIVARVHALLRRSPAKQTAAASTEQSDDHGMIRIHDDLRLDLESRLILVGDEQVELTRIEFDLLATLLRRPKMVFTRRQLVEQVWGNDWYGDEHVVDVHLANVRRKLNVVGAGSYVVTVRGVGYRMSESRLSHAD